MHLLVDKVKACWFFLRKSMARGLLILNNSNNYKYYYYYYLTCSAQQPNCNYKVVKNSCLHCLHHLEVPSLGSGNPVQTKHKETGTEPLASQTVSYFQFSRSKLFKWFSTFPVVLHVPPISFCMVSFILISFGEG